MLLSCTGHLGGVRVRRVRGQNSYRKQGSLDYHRIRHQSDLSEIFAEEGVEKGSW